MACETAAMPNDGELNLRAKMMAARHALATVHATSRVPTHAHPLANSNSPGIWADSGDASNDFVAEDGRVLGNAPVVIQDREIGVAQTAVLNGDLNILRPGRSKVDDVKLERLFGRVGNPCFAGVHS
jgi:hypothetical protein